jgi:hypothetical protein
MTAPFHTISLTRSGYVVFFGVTGMAVSDRWGRFTIQTRQGGNTAADVSGAPWGALQRAAALVRDWYRLQGRVSYGASDSVARFDLCYLTMNAVHLMLTHEDGIEAARFDLECRLARETRPLLRPGPVDQNGRAGVGVDLNA